MASLAQKGSSKLKKKRFKPKYQKAKLFRANEPLLSVFMWGINHTINELTHVNVPVMLLPDDFKAFSKTKVDNHHFNKFHLKMVEKTMNIAKFELCYKKKFTKEELNRAKKATKLSLNAN